MRFFLFLALIAGLPFLLYAQQNAPGGNGQISFSFQAGAQKEKEDIGLTKDPHPLDRPPFSGAVFPATTQGRFFTLKQTSARKNEVTDDAAWFVNNFLVLPEYELASPHQGTEGNVPAKVPAAYQGNVLVRAIRCDSTNFFIYGKDLSSGWLLLITNGAADSVLHFLDFGNYVLSPEYVKKDLDFIGQRILWVAAEDSVLYVSHAHNTYAASSKNMHAYITAINLRNYQVIWRSRPLVCNALNFEVYKDMIICGYGFTAEPDFLYTLDKRSGVVVQTIPLKSGPSYIVRKDDRVFVRTYNTDYVFKIEEE